MPRYALLLLGAASIQGCTVIHVNDANGTTSISRKLGVIAVEPGPATSVVRVTSLGIHSAFGVLSIGFGRSEAVSIDPARCQLIVWATSPATLNALKELMGTDTGVCTIEGSTTHNTRGAP